MSEISASLNVFLSESEAVAGNQACIAVSTAETSSMTSDNGTLPQLAKCHRKESETGEKLSETKVAQVRMGFSLTPLLLPTIHILQLAPKRFGG